MQKRRSEWFRDRNGDRRSEWNFSPRTVSRNGDRNGFAQCGNTERDAPLAERSDGEDPPAAPKDSKRPSARVLGGIHFGGRDPSSYADSESSEKSGPPLAQDVSANSGDAAPLYEHCSLSRSSTEQSPAQVAAGAPPTRREKTDAKMEADLN